MGSSGQIRRFRPQEREAFLVDRAMVFGKYCLLERISVGGMAEVFRAKPLPAHQSDKMLALKRILPHLAEDEEFITMFVDEAKLTVALDHPNIVETYELGNFQASYYILMEYIAGQDVLALQKRLRQNRRIMSVAQACYVARQVARGLHYAHTACDEEGHPYNIIHRDVSPQNVRLTWDGRVKLIDFGIAKAAVQRTKTQVGVLKGKFGYMSPEQVRGEEIDHRSDVFALGTTLWEMLTNRRLFNGENEYETLQMVKHPEIPPPSEKNAQVPPAVDDIVMGALAEDRRRRFQSCAEFGDALNRFLSSMNEPYTKDHLSAWLAKTFTRELEEERQKRQLYRQIKTPEDVQWFNREYVDAAAVGGARSGESLVGEDESRREAPENDIWDPDFAPEDAADVDHEEFATDHTVVAAGGFDPSQFEDEEDDVISLADVDIIEVEDQARSSGGESDSGGGSAPVQNDSAQNDSAQVPQRESSRERDASEGGASSPRAGARRREEGADTSSERAKPETDRTTTAPAAEAGDNNTVRMASALAAVVAVFVLAVTVGYMALASGDRGWATENPTASMVISVEPTPSRRGELLVDDKLRGRETPLTVSNLEPGDHEIEVRYPGYKSVERVIHLKPGALRSVEVRLDEDPNARARIRLSIPDADGEIRVYLDGRETDWSSDEPLYVGAGRHLLEVVAPEKRLWSRLIDVGPGEAVTERVEWMSDAAALRFEASEEARVEVDGEEIGTTPVTAEGLEPGSIHRVFVVSEESDAKWSSHVGFPRLGQKRLQIDFDDPPATHEEGDFGWLTVDSGEDWWSVMVDGAPTGRRTPVDDSSRLPVVEGKHTVALRRGREMREFDVEIEAGETTSLEREVSFDWSETEN